MIRCMQTEDYCPGTADFRMIRDKAGAFAGTEEESEIIVSSTAADARPRKGSFAQGSSSGAGPTRSLAHPASGKARRSAIPARLQRKWRSLSGRKRGRTSAFSAARIEKCRSAAAHAAVAPRNFSVFRACRALVFTKFTNRTAYDVVIGGAFLCGAAREKRTRSARRNAMREMRQAGGTQRGRARQGMAGYSRAGHGMDMCCIPPACRHPAAARSHLPAAAMCTAGPQASGRCPFAHGGRGDVD